MKLRLSVATRDRAFARAMRRIRPRFDNLMELFAKAELVNPIHEAILVGVTDDKRDELLEEVANGDGFFQVLVGVQMKRSDSDLAQAVFEMLRRAASACPFSKPDHETIQSVFDVSEPGIMGRQG